MIGRTCGKIENYQRKTSKYKNLQIFMLYLNIHFEETV